MTIRIALLPYGPSNSCVDLRNAIRQVIVDNNLDASITLLRHENSRYVARSSDVLINYGNRRMPESFFGSATVLNSLQALNRAANKLQALDSMSQAGVPVVEYTTQQQVAQSWVDSGEVVYSRAVLNGHSGEGITVHAGGANNNHNVPSAPLYTKGITSQRREWRVHIFKGVITYVQLKRRRDGYREDDNYRDDVRNHHTGWIYSTANITPSDEVLRAAVDAVEALGLDFGAVDIISRQSSAWVLEVNTAPGLTGTTLETYKHNFMEFSKNVVTGSTPNYIEAYPVPPRIARAPLEEATPEPVAPAVPPIPETSVGVSIPQTHAESLDVEVPHTPASHARTRGMYLVDVMSDASNIGIVARNVIMYHVNGSWFRHGWNLPVHPNLVQNARKISSVVLENAVPVNVQ